MKRRICFRWGHKPQYLFIWTDHRDVPLKQPDRMDYVCKRCGGTLYENAPNRISVWASLPPVTRAWFRNNVEPWINNE